MVRAKRQIEIEFPCTWGGRRKGAGRRRRHPRKRVAHTARPALAARFPVHVTVRLLGGLPRLRGYKQARALRHAFVHGCDKGVFRICQFSVQGNHIHLVCEAREARSLAAGIKAWKTSVTRQLNKLWHRTGTVWDDRYHAQIIENLRQLRATLCYVLQNALRHRVSLPHWANGIDPFSSAWYFDGWRTNAWRRGLAPPHDDQGAPVATAQTWFLARGWRCHGLIRVDEVPVAAQR